MFDRPTVPPVLFAIAPAVMIDYARARREVALTPDGALFRFAELGLGLSTRCPLEIVAGRDVRARIAVRAGETSTFVLDRFEPGELRVPYSDADISAEFDATVVYGRRWPPLPLREAHGRGYEVGRSFGGGRSGQRTSEASTRSRWLM